MPQWSAVTSTAKLSTITAVMAISAALELMTRKSIWRDGPSPGLGFTLASSCKLFIVSTLRRHGGRE